MLIHTKCIVLNTHRHKCIHTPHMYREHEWCSVKSCRHYTPVFARYPLIRRPGKLRHDHISLSERVPLMALSPESYQSYPTSHLVLLHCITSLASEKILLILQDIFSPYRNEQVFFFFFFLLRLLGLDCGAGLPQLIVSVLREKCLIVLSYWVILPQSLFSPVTEEDTLKMLSKNT